MTRYKDAGTVQDEIEQALGEEIDGVTVYHGAGEIDVHGVTENQMDHIQQNVNPERPAMGRPSDRPKDEGRPDEPQ